MPITKPNKQKIAAKPLADPDALQQGVPDHVKYPEISPMPPLSGSTTQSKEIKRRIKAVKKRLRS